MSDPFPENQLAFTLAPLVSDSTSATIKEALDRSRVSGLRWVQIAATMPGLRPRDLDSSARRDLVASLRRRELNLAGLDAWIPAEHFVDAAKSDRAVASMVEIIAMAGELGRVPVSLIMPKSAEVVDALVAAAERSGIELADHGVDALSRAAGAGVGIGIDPAACLANGGDPAAAVHAAAGALVSARLVDLMRSGMRGPIGSEHELRLDVQAYKIALSVNAYRRPVVIDARQWIDPLRGIEQTVRVWDQT